jgi:M6 family metalloprotease-like protein
MVCSIWAIPARRGGIVKTQPDGSEVVVYQHGDEFFHWETNEKGEWLALDKDGFYQVTEALSKETISAKRAASPLHIAPKEEVASPLNIAPKGLVILVNFADLAFTETIEEMDSMHNGMNYTRDYEYVYRGKTYQVSSEGSVRQYFYDASFGQYNPQFDVIGPVTVSREYSYYGKNTAATDFDQRPWEMIKEACLLADTVWNVDFTQYDNDGDGKVDFVYVIYAGYGEADGGGANTIWPHSYQLSAAGVYCQVDGVRVNLYACGNEIDYFTKQHTGIGTFCHEFSHVLGLPDLYTTEGQTHKTWGEWSILDYGPYNNDGNTPPAYSAYERFFMGWLTPEVIVDSANIRLEELNSSQQALLISTGDKHNLIGNDPQSTRFYLLENRQQHGWDAYLPGHGLMLTYVQYNANTWKGNTVNNNSRSMGVDLIEADGKAPNSSGSGYLGKATDLFPAGATAYTNITDHAIEEIEEIDGVIHFKYRGGAVGTHVEDVEIPTSVIAIYNILGQKQPTTDMQTLSAGTYIVVTTTGTRKIIR